MNRMNCLGSMLNNQRGSVIVLLAIVMTGLLAGAAVVTDIGVNYVIQGRLSIAADAAALAAGTKLGGGYDEITQLAVTTAEKNGVPAERVIVEVDNDAKGVTVRTQAPMQLYFAQIFGAEGGVMEQRARVALTRPIAFMDIYPLGLDEEITFEYFKHVNLYSKELLGSGNWGALYFDDSTGTSTYRVHLQEGYPGLVTIGDDAESKGGATPQAIKKSLDYRFQLAAETHQCQLGECPPDCARILVLPIYRAVLDNNQNKTSEVIIVDFAAFWVSEYDIGGAKTEIWGYFIKPNVNPAISVEGESPYGMTATRLVE
ncbi:MAG: pilus assembly protein TadG-related protein [Bacillota bacterium]|nr:pilus assembly protein TadG-related protein [Bacillota bacterium]MDW7683945.1 pilus assembly protein TadG-related protein [Bacillota bacterium]